MTTEQELANLTSNVSHALKEAYETGYSRAVKDTREEVIATIRERKKVMLNLGRDTTEMVILISILERERL